MSDLPTTLVPQPGECGMASGDRVLLATLVREGWDGFIRYAQTCDLATPSRRKDWLGRDVVVQLGLWPTARGSSASLIDARAGRAVRIDQDAESARLRSLHVAAPMEDVWTALSAARDDAVSFLGSSDDDADGLRLTSSPLGPIPVRTLVLAGAYQLAICALDLEPCAPGPAPDPVLRSGLIALVDTTGALAARHDVTGSITALLPDDAWGFGARSRDWRTSAMDRAAAGPAVEGSARVILDITAGRVADVPGLYRRGEIKLRDIPGLLPMAVVVDSVPGIPGGAALKQTARVLSGVTKLTGLFRRRS